MNDPLKELSQKAINARLNPKIILSDSGINIEDLRKAWESQSAVIVAEPSKIEFLDLEELKEELAAASDYIAENEVIHKKMKKDIPTVIEYRGRRYILDHADHRK